MGTPALAADPTEPSTSSVEAVYLGVKDYGTVTKSDKDNFQHRFSVNGEEKLFTVSTGASENYAIQNTLQEGYIYDLTVTDSVVTAATLLDKGSDRVVMGTVDAVDDTSITVDGTKLTVGSSVPTYEITAAAGGASVETATVSVGDSVKVTVDGTAAKTIYKAFVSADYTPPVQGTPGLKTLKNFLATAVEPVGTGLYVYGGTWDWQDDNSSNQSMTIGIPQSWIDFFQSQDENYRYRNNDDKAHSYYPHNSWNQYYYAGVDCSGYVGWVLYNTINTESATVTDDAYPAYVMGSTKMAKTFASYGWGTWERSTEDGFHVGDIFSMSGHVWICLGTCDDGSIVFLHSTPSDSKAGASGGGIQISAISPDETKDCEAYRLADYYMTTYYPAWSERYDAILRTYSNYTAIASNANAGKFTWDLSGNALLTDPDGYANMKPAEILADLFGENAKTEPTVAFDLNTPSMAQFAAIADMTGTLCADGTAVVVLPDAPKNLLTAQNGGHVYDFLGWKVGDAVYQAGDQVTISSNVTAIAQWHLHSVNGDKNWNIDDALTIMQYVQSAAAYPLTAEQLALITELTGDRPEDFDIDTALCIMQKIQNKELA
jgi:hypothetical protein